MNRAWLAGRRHALVRDLVRDYCRASIVLAVQERRFARDGTISHAIVRALLGEENSKGVLWRLKDTAHHLFGNGGASHAADPGVAPAPAAAPHTAAPAPSAAPKEQMRLAGELVDWCVGYAFHECVKLREDAWQRQHYANRLLSLAAAHNGAETAEPGEERACASGDTLSAAPRACAVLPDALLAPLAGLAEQTASSTARELARVRLVLNHGLFLLGIYLETERDNACLARWLAVEAAQAAAAFGPLWPGLLERLYAGADGLYSLAARDLEAAGRPENARRLLAEARDRLGPRGLALLERLEAGAGAAEDAAGAA